MKRKITYYRIILIDKNGYEHYYVKDTLNGVKILIEWAIEKQQSIKEIKGLTR